MLHTTAKAFFYAPKWLWLRLTVLASLAICVMIINFSGSVTPINSFADCAQAGYPILESNPPACRAPGHTFTGPLEPVATPGPAQLVQPFSLLVQGDIHTNHPRHQEIISTELQWRTFWNRVHSGVNPIPPLLSVDFSKNDVIALVEGPQPTAGYALKAASVLVAPTGSIINVIRQVPTVTCKVDEATTNRYYMALTAKLPQPVIFKTATTYRKC